MFELILKYSFLGIFLCTAILGIGSLPDWIKIPEWYKKKIFVALILEVVGAIIILFNNLTEPKLGTLELKIRNNNWVAMNEKAQFVSPEIEIEINDTLFKKNLETASFTQFRDLQIVLGENSLNIMNTDKNVIGEISKKKLEETGLFNTIETARDEISSSENYSYIKWKKETNDSKWEEYGIPESPFHLIVYDEDNKTKYKIINTVTGDVKFYSDSKSGYLFDEDNRINHFYNYNNKYYLIRIAFADLFTENNKYVNIIYIRLNPTFKIN